MAIAPYSSYEWQLNNPPSEWGNEFSNSNKLSDPVARKQESIVAMGSFASIIYGRIRTAGRLMHIGNIGTDLVVSWLWGIGRLRQIEQFFINQVLPTGGITVKHYLGAPTQALDPTLEEALTGFTDTMPGIAYTVARIPVGAIEGWPRASATIRGLFVNDPRIGSSVESDNPALALADLASKPRSDYGLGLTVLGTSEAADWCDDFMATGVSRARLGIELRRPQFVWSYIQLLAQYAECFLVWEGDKLRLVPDATATSVKTFGPSTIVKDSLNVSITNMTASPDLVRVRYTEETADGEPWFQNSVEFTEAETPQAPYSLSRDGVIRRKEADRRAEQIYRQSQFVQQLSFVGFDDAVLIQRGDLIRYLDTIRNIDVVNRVQAVDMVGLGRYRITAHQYDDSIYATGVAVPRPRPIVEKEVEVGVTVASYTFSFDFTPQEGELIWIAFTVSLSSNPATVDSTPSGFTVHRNVDINDPGSQHFVIVYKIATAAETNSYTFTFSHSITNIRGVAYRIVDFNPSTIIFTGYNAKDISGSANSITAGPMSIPDNGLILASFRRAAQINVPEFDDDYIMANVFYSPVSQPDSPQWMAAWRNNNEAIPGYELIATNNNTDSALVIDVAAINPIAV